MNFTRARIKILISEFLERDHYFHESELCCESVYRCKEKEAVRVLQEGAEARTSF